MIRLLLAFVASTILLIGCATTNETMTSDQGGMMENQPENVQHEMMEEQQGHHGEAQITKHFEGSMTKLTDNELYSLELIVPEKNLSMGANKVEIIVHHALGGDVAQADLTVTPWMPTMGHGVMEEPVVIERGGGLYSVENVIFSMTGYWQLKVTVDKDDKVDTAVFDFPEVKVMGHEHSMMQAAPPKDLDYSTQKTSHNGVYQVEYKSIGGNIRTNRIHSWELVIKDAQGKTVDDARVTVVGDMPEHGHGLPTQPVVTRIGMGGLYRIDGMKFSMPGWWVVTFSIMADGVPDTVTFNLSLL